MIKQDSISMTFTILAVLVAVYLSTFELGTLILFPVILLIAGIVLQQYYLRKIEYTDRVYEEKTASNIMFYTFLAIIGILTGAYFTTYFLYPKHVLETIEMSIVDLRLFGILMAVAEEQFFRGFITNFFLDRLPPMPAIFVSGGIFTIYHLAVYGSNPSAMLYVLIAGIMLSYVAFLSGRLSPTILAHVINNVLAV
jgi:membrane protease YdiL (CAAX protease family)